MDDLFETETQYERAMTAVLESKIDHIIVSDEQEVQDAIQFLTTEQRGRCTFTPMEPKIMDGSELSSSLPETARPVIELLRTDNQFQPLFNFLLNSTYLVPNLADALEARQIETHPVTLVTLDGEVISKEGSITGGYDRSEQFSYRSRKREISQLTTEMKKQTARFTELDVEQTTAVNVLNQWESDRLELMEHKSRLELSIATVLKDKDHTAQRFKQAGIRREAIGTEITMMDKELEELCIQRDSLETQDVQTQDTISVTDQIRQLESRLEELLKIQDDSRIQSTDLRVRNEATKERLTSLKKEQVQLTQESQRLLDLVLRLRKKAANVSDRKDSTEKELEQVTRELEEKLEAIPGMEIKVRNLTARLDRERTAETAMEDELRDLERRLKEVENQQSELKINKAEIESARSMITEQFGDYLDVELTELPELPSDQELADWRVRAKDLEEALFGFGDVNLAAEAEHRELVERSKFLEEQIKDLEDSIRSLRSTIQQINQTSRKRFVEAFEIINSHFQTIFTQLFEGGHAALQLKDPDDPLESGVEIICQPPGKRARNIDLLSGGEKALSALALLISSFQYRPSPILFLDEVDASLDEANVMRFTRFLKNLSSHTQIMMITHNAITMEAADILYGITMSEPGVSRLVSAKFGLL